MSITGLVILAIVIASAILGMKKGLVRKLSGVVSILISCFLVNLLLPQVTTLLREQTGVYEWIADRTGDIVGAQVSRIVPAQVLEGYGIAADQAGAVSGELGRSILSGLSRTQQTSLIRSLPLPDFLQKMMESYNNSEGYRKLRAADFSDYLVRFIADIILNVLAFVATLAVTWLVVRGIVASLHLLSRLPVVGAVNRIGGLLCGALQGLFVVWFLMLLVSLLSGTQAGMAIQDQMDKSMALWPVLESNVFLKIITNAVGKI